MKLMKLTKAQFDAKRSELEVLVTDWTERECISFDEAVRGKPAEPSSGSIWKMPAVDSKRLVALLVELEPVIGCEIPCSVIRRGGYARSAQVVADLLARIRDRCLDDPAPGARTPELNSVASAAQAGSRP